MNNKFPMFFLVLLLPSCGAVYTPEYLPLIQSVLFGAKDIKVDQDFYDDQPYSFAKVNLGREQTAIVTLGFGDTDAYKWYTSSGAGIFTKDGKIVKLTSFVHDMSLINPAEIVYNQDTILKNSSFISLKNPKGFFLQEFKLEFHQTEEIDYLSQKLQVDLYLEVVTTEGYNWSYTNKYWVDPSSGMVIKSVQKVHPRSPAFTLTYFYKYL
ncbi:YjbF family lipoprotein [Gammaproteobacteria bacterium]|nr:YjbF family lipoprotein [Gammaproteobacteria bacterium]MDB9816139.1 YjbF family lipoprotein [Gammaproteobacteria bacterium]MDB9859486.1 YjbF family lipoprotein [Gammaproteobacteria bacterium]